MNVLEAADAMRNAAFDLCQVIVAGEPVTAEKLDALIGARVRYDDASRTRHASGAQPDSACDEIGWLVEITGPKYWTGTPGCGNWTADSLAAMRFARRQDAEAACRHLAPSGAIPVEHAWVSHRPAGAQPSGAPAPASAQGEVCECGHGSAMHLDGDGLHDGECLYRAAGEPDYCPCERFTPQSSEKTGEERK